MTRNEHIRQAEICIGDSESYMNNLGGDERNLERARHYRELAHIHTLLAQMMS